MKSTLSILLLLAITILSSFTNTSSGSDAVFAPLVSDTNQLRATKIKKSRLHIGHLSVEPRKFKSGVPISVVVNIINEGPDENPEAVVTLFINGQQIGSRKTGPIGPKQIKQVEFPLTLTQKQSENILQAIS